MFVVSREKAIRVVISLCLCDVLMMFSSLKTRVCNHHDGQAAAAPPPAAANHTQRFRSWTADLQHSPACAVNHTISSAQDPLLTDSWTQTGTQKSEKLQWWIMQRHRMIIVFIYHCICFLKGHFRKHVNTVMCFYGYMFTHTYWVLFV